MTGIEPATSGTTIRRSNQLSYTHHQSIELRLKAKGKVEPRKAGSDVGSAPLHLDPGRFMRRPPEPRWRPLALTICRACERKYGGGRAKSPYCGVASGPQASSKSTVAKNPGALRGWRGNAMLALIVLKDQTLFDVSYSNLWAVWESRASISGCPLRRARTNRHMVASSGAGYSSFGGGALSCTAVPRVRKTVANFLLVGMLVSMASCGPYRRSRGGGTNDLILRSEILQVPDRSAFTLIRLLRPRWLAARIQATPQNPTPAYAHIYVDNLAYGPIESLYDISSNMIDRINFIGSLDATTLYGTGFMGGVIHVHTRRGG